MKYLLIDGGKDLSYLHLLDAENGEYGRVRSAQGNISDQVDKIVLAIIRDKPNRVIFDKSGISMGLYQTFINGAKQYGIKVDDKGTITYN